MNDRRNNRDAKLSRKVAKKRKKIEDRLRRVYGARNAILRGMGFATYADYLASPLWAGIRLRVHARDRGICVRCRQPAHETHHRDYSEMTLRGDSIDMLVSVCGECHERAEFNKKGFKNDLCTANSVLFEKVNQNKKLARKAKWDNLPVWTKAKIRGHYAKSSEPVSSPVEAARFKGYCQKRSERAYRMYSLGSTLKNLRSSPASPSPSRAEITAGNEGDKTGC